MKKEADKKPRKYRLNNKDREYLTANLALMLKASVPVGEALESLKDASNSAVFKKAIGQVNSDISEGTPLWKALEKSGVTGVQTVTLVRMGEESGNMVANLEVAAVQEAKQHILQAKIRSALIYPVFVISLTGLVGLAIAWFLLPRLAQTFLELNVQLPLISRIFLRVGIFLKSYGIIAVPSVAIGLIAAIYIFFFAPKTKAIGNWLLFATPGIGRLMREVEIARFGYLFGILLDAGLGVTRSFELLETSTSARRYKQFYRDLKQAFEEGYGFREALPKYNKHGKLLPVQIQQLIIAGEHSGALADTLKNIGTSYEQRSDTTAQNLNVILEPILLVIIAAGVLCVAIAVILPVYKLSSSVSN